MKAHRVVVFQNVLTEDVVDADTITPIKRHLERNNLEAIDLMRAN